METTEARPHWYQPAVQKARGLFGDPCQTRVALVIGNGAYEHHRPLRCPVADAQAMTIALEDAGFQTHSFYDADADTLNASIEDFVKEADGSAVVLIFYSGHGVQLSGENYILPVDAPEGSAEQRDAMLSLNRLVTRVSPKAGTAIVLLDACRNDPAAPDGVDESSGSKSASAPKPGDQAQYQGPRGLAEMTGANVTIGFAAEPGSFALEPKEGKHSIFTGAVLNHIATRGLEFDDLLRRTGRDVQNQTTRRQIPWRNAAMYKEFFFRPRSYFPVAVALFLGLISGILSAAWLDRVNFDITFLKFPVLTADERFFPSPTNITWVPAVLFSCAIWGLKWAYDRRDVMSMLIVFFFVFLGWFVAIQIPFLYTKLIPEELLQKAFAENPEAAFDSLLDQVGAFPFAMMFLAAGAIGATIAVFGMPLRFNPVQYDTPSKLRHS